VIGQVFFRAGVLGEMEELRDDKISKLFMNLQSHIRWYQTQKKYEALKKQRLALEVVQRSLRSYVRLRCWPWWGLWKVIKPTLKISNIADEMKVSSRLKQND
jgi:myosin heavy chain 6/7